MCRVEFGCTADRHSPSREQQHSERERAIVERRENGAPLFYELFVYFAWYANTQWMLVCSRSRTTTKLSVYWKSVRVKLCNILCIHTYKAQEVARADIKRSSSCERKEKVGKRQLQLLISARDTQSIKLHSAQTKTIFSLELCCVLLFLQARERESSYFFLCCIFLLARETFFMCITNTNCANICTSYA